MLREIADRLLTSRPFVRNVFTLLSGTVIAQIIIVSITPILSRLYSPGDFGILSIYLSLIGILSGIVCWRYEIGIALPEKDDDAVNLLQLAIFAALLTSIVLLILVGAFRGPFSLLMKSPQLSPWLWFAPINLFVIGLYQAFSYWATRQKNFNVLQRASVGRSVAGSLFRLCAGIVTRAGAAGLVIGQVVSDFAGLTTLTFKMSRAEFRRIFQSLDKEGLVKVGRGYSELPLNALSTVFLNSISVNAIPLLVAWLFDPFLTGLMMFAQRTISLPINVITTSVWQVTHSELGRVAWPDRVKLFARVHKFVSYLYAFPLVAIATFGNLAGAVLGAEWTDLQRILPSLSLMLFINAVSNSTSYFAAFGLYRAESIANIALIVIRLMSLLIGARFYGFYTAISLYCIFSAVMYLGITCFWALRLGKVREFAGNLLLSCLISFMILIPLKLLFKGSLLFTILAILLAGGLYYYLVLVRFQNSIKLRMN